MAHRSDCRRDLWRVQCLDLAGGRSSPSLACVDPPALPATGITAARRSRIGHYGAEMTERNYVREQLRSLLLPVGFLIWMIGGFALVGGLAHLGVGTWPSVNL